MKKIIWISIALFALLWYAFSKIWLNDPSKPFQFSDRDKSFVFPVQKTTVLEEEILVPTIENKVATNAATSSSDSSIIKF